MAIDNILPANSTKAMLSTRHLLFSNNNNNMNILVDTSSGLVGGTNNNNPPSGSGGNITNLGGLTNPNPQELIMVTTTQGIMPSYSGIAQQNAGGPSGFVCPVVNTGPRRSTHPTRAGKKIIKASRLTPKSIPTAGGFSSAPSSASGGFISAPSSASGAASCSSTSFNSAYNASNYNTSNNTINFINFNNNEETIHSGHFMLSQVHDEDLDYEDDDVVVKEENDSRGVGGLPEGAGFDFLNATQETSASYDFGTGCTQFLSIDGSLTKLFECMSLAYSGKIISPKWKPFKGMRLRGKEIVRLNNIIWREWFMQYIQNKRPIVCQFANPLPDDIHKRTEAVVMEGKYWKRRFESVTGEYKSWRKFSKNLIAEARRNSTTSKGSFQNDLYEWSYQGKAGNQEGADIPFSMEDMEFSDTLFSLNQPFPFPNPRELSQTGYAELIQPVLTQLQPNLDDYMDTLEPIQMISDMLSTSRSQGFPSQNSPMSSSYHSLPDSLLVAMDNDLPPSLQVRMDAASPVLSLRDQQIREKEQSLGILPPSPGFGSSNLHSEGRHTRPTSQQDNSATLSSVFPHFSLCGPVSSLGDAEVVRRGSAPETPIAPLSQTDTTHLLNKILMQQPQTLPQTASHSLLNQQTQLVQQPPLQQQGPLSSRVIAGPHPAAAAVGAHPAPKDDSYSKDIEFMLLKTIYNAYRDPMAPSKQPGQQPLAPSAPLPAPAHTPQPQLSSVHQRDPTLVGGVTGSLPMLAVAQPTRVLHQAGQILSQTSGTNSLLLGAAAEGSSNRVITLDRTIDDSPTPDNRSSPTGDLFQVGSGSGRKRQSISKTPSSGRNQGFVIPTTTPMIRSKIRTVTVSPPSTARTEISSSSSASSANTFLAQLLTTGKYHGAAAGTDVKPEPSWKPCIISTVSLATTTTVTPAYPRIQSAQDSTTPTQCTSTNPVTLACSSPNSISISFTQPSVLGKASSGSSHMSNFSPSVLPAVSSPTFPRNQQSQDITPSAFNLGKHANPACSPSDPNSTPNSPTLSLGSPLSSGQEMDTSFPSSQQKGACPKSKQVRGHCREHRRVSHISAEQKRRCNIKSGFDVLHSLIPSLNSTPCGKVSKAAMLQKAAEFCKKMKAERLKMQTESEVLKVEIDSLNSDITYCQSQLPATGAPVTRQRVDQMNNMYTDYVRTRTSENWKFYIFSFIIHPLFNTFNNIVSTSSMEEMCQTVMNWFDQYCSLVTLRPTVSNALREVCTSTTILTEPERLPEQAASVTGLPRRRHSISGEIDIS